MITIDLEVHTDLSDEDVKKAVQRLEEEFPSYADHRVKVEGYHILLQLAQTGGVTGDELPIEQERYLNKQEWLRVYTIRSGSLYAGLEPWQEETIAGLLNRYISPVFQDQYSARYYSQTTTSLCHLLDIDQYESVPRLSIREINFDEMNQITIGSNEFDTFLATLLRWKLDHAKPDEEPDDHPF